MAFPKVLVYFRIHAGNAIHTEHAHFIWSAYRHQSNGKTMTGFGDYIQAGVFQFLYLWGSLQNRTMKVGAMTNVAKVVLDREFPVTVNGPLVGAADDFNAAIKSIKEAVKVPGHFTQIVRQWLNVFIHTGKNQASIGFHSWNTFQSQLCFFRLIADLSFLRDGYQVARGGGSIYPPLDSQNLGKKGDEKIVRSQNSIMKQKHEKNEPESQPIEVTQIPLSLGKKGEGGATRY